MVVAGVVLLAACAGRAPAEHGADSRPPGSRGPSSTTSPRAPDAFRPTRASPAPATWRLPFAVARAAVTEVAGDPRRSLLAGGMLANDTSTDRVIEIDPTNGRFRDNPPLAIRVHDAAGGSYAGHPAVYGGGNGSEQSAVQELLHGHWRQVARLPSTRSDLSVATVGGRSIVIGGYDGADVPRSILAQTGGALRPQGHLQHGVRYAATAVVGQDIFVFGGEVDHRELGDVQRVDGRTGQTSVVAQLPRPLGHAVAVYAGGRVLLMGGRTGPDQQTSAMWWFDPDRDRFTPAGHLPGPLSDSSAVALRHRIWLLGGENPHVTDHVVVITLS
ncbi:MAG: Kelch repeat-containing protein [Marmoricola sp.]|nr:Kelch repeat-containing protein [Marmoricola sp.]